MVINVIYFCVVYSKEKTIISGLKICEYLMKEKSVNIDGWYHALMLKHVYSNVIGDIMMISQHA